VTVETLGGLLVVTATVIVASVVLLWLVSLRLRNASIIDLFWGFGFVVIAWVAWLVLTSGGGSRRRLLLVLATAWGLRLAGYLTWRNTGKGEDFRYRAMRERWGPRFPLVSLVTVFLLQAVLMLVVSLPVQAGMLTGGAVGIAGVIGVVLWAAGVVFETIGDLQLARFKRDPANRDIVMDRGLWRYTRHPNYFGDFCVCWGFYLIALTAATWWTAAGPLLMSFLLLRVSGVSLLEKDIGSRRPGYAEYVRRTNAFFPGKPKEVASSQ
jgi:steroid 5-alpha reductase family enzyme